MRGLPAWLGIRGFGQDGAIILRQGITIAEYGHDLHVVGQDFAAADR